MEFEKDLIEAFADSMQSGEISQPAAKTESTLFVVSEPFMTGGHTRLMERLAEGLLDKPNLLVTRSARPDILQRLGNYFNAIVIINADEAIKRKVVAIAQQIVAYQQVVLNIHPDDIVTVIACGLAKKIFTRHQILFFVNHADHVFNYGASIADYWFQISAYGAKIDRLRGLKGQVTFF